MAENKTEQLKTLNSLKIYAGFMSDSSSSTFLYKKLCEKIDELKDEGIGLKELEMRKTAQDILAFTKDFSNTEKSDIAFIQTMETLSNYIIELTHDFVDIDDLMSK